MSRSPGTSLDESQADENLYEALSEAVVRGDEVHFDQSPWKDYLPGGRLKASLIGRLVTGPLAPTGVQIFDAVIYGAIDLRNARGPGGGAANTLKLERCQLRVDDPSNQPALDGRHSHLSRLSLKNCWTTGLHLSSAVVDGDLILEGLKPLPDPRHDPPECWIRSRGIRVGGSVVVSRAQLRSPDKCPEYWGDPATRYALDLLQARIGGSLEFRGRFKGGVRLVLATIGGDLRADGARLQAVDHGDPDDSGHCIRGRGADIHGTVLLRSKPGRPFVARGTIDIAYATIGGAVIATGARLRRPNHLEAQARSLSLVGSTIGAGVWLFSDEQGPRFEATDLVDMQDAHVGGMTRVEAGAGFRAWDAAFGNSLDLTANGNVDLDGARIAGDATITVQASDGDIHGLQVRGDAITSVSAVGLEVEHSVSLRGTLAGVARFTNSTIGHDVVLGLMAGAVHSPDSTIDFRGASIGGDFAIERLILSSGNGRRWPRLSLYGATIRHDLRVPRPSTAGGILASQSSFGRPVVRSMALSVFPGWRLAEAAFPPDPWPVDVGPIAGAEVTPPSTAAATTQTADPAATGTIPTLRFLYKSGDPNVVVLDGTSAPIFDRMTLGKPRLGTADRAEEYLTLFCDHVWGPEGAFVIVDPLSPLGNHAQRSADALPESERPPRIELPTRSAARSWRAVADVMYGSALYRAKFRISNSGEVSMEEDWPLDSQVPEAMAMRWGQPDAPFRLERWAPRDLGTKDQIEEYLAAYCARISVDSGSTEIIDPSSSLGVTAEQLAMANEAEDTVPLVGAERVRDGSWTVVANLRHLSGLSRARFVVKPSGHVALVNLWTLIEQEQADLAGTTLNRLGPAVSWEQHDSEADVAFERVREKLGLHPSVDLRGLSLGTMDDLDGEAWPSELRLDLDGCQYLRTGSSPTSQPTPRNAGDGIQAAFWGATPTVSHRSRLRKRLRWLKEQQYGTRVPEAERYRPQPFEQLARVWRAEGSPDAGDVTFERLCYERAVYDGWVTDGLRLRVRGRRLEGRALTLVPLAGVLLLGLALLITLGTNSVDAWGALSVAALLASLFVTRRTSTLRRWFLQLPFGYGLRFKRAAGTFVLLWLIGGGLVFLGTLPGLDVMKVEASAPGTIAREDEEIVVPVGGQGGQPEVRCGNQIDPMLYALDVMVPLLDLRQEQRCTVSADRGAWFWRLLKVSYAVLGWIVVSGMVLTASGIVRRQIER